MDSIMKYGDYDSISPGSGIEIRRPLTDLEGLIWRFYKYDASNMKD